MALWGGGVEGDGRARGHQASPSYETWRPPTHLQRAGAKGGVPCVEFARRQPSVHGGAGEGPRGDPEPIRGQRRRGGGGGGAERASEWRAGAGGQLGHRSQCVEQLLRRQSALAHLRRRARGCRPVGEWPRAAQGSAGRRRAAQGGANTQ